MNRTLRYTAFLLLFDSLLSVASFSETTPSSSLLDRRLVGNVYGTVVDAATSRPIRGAEVFLLDQPMQKAGNGRMIRSNRGDFALPDFRSAVRTGTTNERGEFLINSVPTPFPFKLYTVITETPGYRLFIIDRVRVLPGAVMALRVDCRVAKGEADEAIVFNGSDPDAPLKYRHEEAVLPKIAGPEHVPFREAAGLTCTVFATREGLVGGTTANGHIIVSQDHFVALPSLRALNPDDRTYHFQVELSLRGKTARAPVWDIGPWNTNDDYWNPSSIREMWKDLPVGTPEAQAAYANGYNGGHDQSGRPVLNPAGVDLADGTFGQDLGMLDNAWISVQFLWRPDVTVGQRVQTTATLNVRSSPAGSSVGQVPAGAMGTITTGPQGAWYTGYFWVWWNIRWDDGVTRGWSVENWLMPLQQPTSARPAWSLYR